MRKISFFTGLIIIVSIIVASCFSSLIREEKPTGKYDYKGVLTLWQIDSFEGGTGSRRQFLMKASRQFERENEGVYTMVISHTAYSANESIKRGEYPDMISFGQGVNPENVKQLISVPYFKGAEVGGKLYAVPWCRGGYVLISRENTDTSAIKKLVVSECEYTQPYVAFIEEELYAENVKGDTPLNAYVEYINDKETCLLGTQRDVMRLIARGESFSVFPLKNFNDLYQYIAVCSKNEDKAYYSQKFVQYLLREETQEKLSDIGMFSAFYKVAYQTEAMDKIDGCEYKKTLFAFSDIYTLKELREISKEEVRQKKYDNIKIKNMLL